ncbi:MAG: FecR domain-containing protein [Rhizomicrobium sp.]
MSDPADNKAVLDPLMGESLEWIVRLTSGAATEADADALMRWQARSPAHVAAFNEALRLRLALRAAGRELALMPQTAAGTHIPHSNRLVGRRALLGGAIAASVAGAFFAGPQLGLWPSLAELSADYRTGKGERRQVMLTTGLLLELNTQTSIAVRSAQIKPRVELISGEAAFTANLPPSNAFTVVAGTGKATATQANFDVRSDGDTVCVTCVTGTVEIAQRERATQIRSGQQLTYTTDALGAGTASDAEAATAWRRGLLIFRDQPLAQMLDVVNRYRPGRIVLVNQQLARRTFNGILQINHIDGVFAQLQKLGAQITELPAGIVLVS